MKEQINQLIEDYKRRLKTCDQMLDQIGIMPDTKDRIITKAACYRILISELERIAK